MMNRKHLQNLSQLEFARQLSRVENFAIDMDGTIYLGNKLFRYTKEFLRGISALGKKFIFITNNSSQNASNYVDKLFQMGIEIDDESIYTSGDATIDYLNSTAPGSKIFLMGTPDLAEDFESKGFSLVDSNPDYVVLGFDKTFNYEKFNKGCRFIRKGTPFIATHPDLNCPVEDGDMIPDCGALSAAFTAATGIRPKVIGKPNREMLEGLISRLNTTKEALCLIGDRLMTDISMGKAFDILTCLVLTGEAELGDLQGIQNKPDFILENTRELLEYF